MVVSKFNISHIIYVLGYPIFASVVTLILFVLCIESIPLEGIVIMVLLITFCLIYSIIIFVKYFEKVNVYPDRIVISRLLNSEEHYLCNFDGYYMTHEIHGYGHNRLSFDAAWLSKGNMLLLKISDFYSNFQEILDATTLSNKGELPIGKYKRSRIVKNIKRKNEFTELYNELFDSMKKEPSSSQKNLNKLEIHIDPQKEAENDSKTYKMN